MGRRFGNDRGAGAVLKASNENSAGLIGAGRGAAIEHFLQRRWLQEDMEAPVKTCKRLRHRQRTRSQ